MKLSNLEQQLLWHFLDFRRYCLGYKWDKTWSTRSLTICLDDVGLAILHFQVGLKTQLSSQKHKNIVTSKLWCSLLASSAHEIPISQMRANDFLLFIGITAFEICFGFQKKRSLVVDVSTQKLQHQLQCDVSPAAFLWNQVDWVWYESAPQESGPEQNCLQNRDTSARSEGRGGEAKLLIIFQLANWKLPWYNFTALRWFGDWLNYRLKKHLFICESFTTGIKVMD